MINEVNGIEAIKHHIRCIAKIMETIDPAADFYCCQFCKDQNIVHFFNDSWDAGKSTIDFTMKISEEE